MTSVDHVRAFGGMVAALAIAGTPACGARGEAAPPPAAPVAPAAPIAPAVEPAAGTGATVAASPAPASTPRCDLGVWDPTAGACAIPPSGATGDPGAWAGCSQATGPQNSRCFTGTHWAECACACNGATRWNDSARRCE